MSGTHFNTPAQLARLARVRALLRANRVTSLAEVAMLLRLARLSALPYLHHLRDCGQAHRHGKTRPSLWVDGPGADWLAPPVGQCDSDPPRVILSPASSPAPVSQRRHVRRDPLVEALFGPAANADSTAAQA